MITIVGVIVLLLMLGVVLVVSGGSKKNSSQKKESTTGTTGENKDKEKEEIEGVIRNEKVKTTPKKDVFDFMEFDNIEDDMIIQNHGRRFSMVIQCKGINYDLMSEVEQLSIEEGFIVFLNTLKYPIQLYVQARTVDLRNSMEIYDQRVKYFQEQFNEAEDNYKKAVNDFNSTDTSLAQARNNRERFANIYEYAEDINRYVGKLSSNKNILQRKFYIIVSYDKSEINSNASFTKEEIQDVCRKELYTRCQSLISSLMSCSVVGKIMFSEELAELLYISYNRDDARILDIKEALNSGAFRMYSTAKDIYDKKREKIEEEIEKEAIRRVQEAIQQTARSSKIQSPDEVEDDFEERTDRKALNIIRQADIPKETKDELTQTIAVNHVLRARENNAKRKRRDAELAESQNVEETIETQETQENQEIEAEQNTPNINEENININNNDINVEPQQQIAEEQPVVQQQISRPEQEINNEPEIAEEPVRKNVITNQVITEEENEQDYSQLYKDDDDSGDEQII